MNRPRLLLAALVAGDAAVLVLLQPQFHRLARDLAAPHAWLRRTGVDQALGTLASAALWVTAAWLALGLLAGSAARLPGVLGRASTLISAALLPRTVHRLIAASIGLSIVVAPVAAVAAPGHTGSRAAFIAGSGSVPGSPSWPAPIWPSADADRPERVVVRPGDSLWQLAARRLGPRASAERIAEEWPRWWARNRDVVGPDPALLHPGQVLVVPSPVAGTDEATA